MKYKISILIAVVVVIIIGYISYDNARISIDEIVSAMGNIYIKQTSKVINENGLEHTFQIVNDSEYDMKNLDFTISYKTDEINLSPIKLNPIIENIGTDEIYEFSIQVPYSYYSSYFGENLIDDKNIEISLDGYIKIVSPYSHISFSGGLISFEDDGGKLLSEEGTETRVENDVN